MKHNKGFEVKLTDKQIVLTKDFSRKVADVNSAEYETFVRLRAAYPTFSIVKYTISHNADREKYGKLTYENMARLIVEWVENSAAALEELEQKIREAKCYAGSYGIVKKWFLGKYGELYAAAKCA